MTGPLTDPALLLALRGAAALLFLAAAWHKLRAPREFTRALSGYGLLPEAALLPATGLLIAAESAIAVACVVPVWSTVGCLAGAALIATYSTAAAIRLARGGAGSDCGCGGPGGERPLGGGLLLRNAVLVALLGIAALPAAARPLVWLDAVTIIGTGLTLTALHAAVDLAAANAARATSHGA